MLLFVKKNDILIVRLLLFCISIVLFSFIYYRFCDHEKDFYYGIFPRPTNTVLNNHIDYLYFSAQIQSTLGFGDMAPKTNKARMMVVSQLLVSFIIFNLEL